MLLSRCFVVNSARRWTVSVEGEVHSLRRAAQRRWHSATTEGWCHHQAWLAGIRWATPGNYCTVINTRPTQPSIPVGYGKSSTDDIHSDVITRLDLPEYDELCQVITALLLILGQLSLLSLRGMVNPVPASSLVHILAKKWQRRKWVVISKKAVSHRLGNYECYLVILCAYIETQNLDVSIAVDTISGVLWDVCGS